MNPRTLTAFAALGCALLAACTPYPESRYRQPNGNQNRKNTVTSPEQQKIQEQRDNLKQKEERQKIEETTKKPTETGNTGTTTTTPEPTKPPAEEKRDYPTANKVPGKEGYVFSPYNNKIISVLDAQDNPIRSGTLVQDPTYPASDKKYFRVP